MNQKLIALLVFALTIGLTAGCRTAPVRDVTGAPISSASSLSTKQIERAIMTGGASKGWIMQRQEPGLIIGTLNIRDHMAQVAISYTRDSYSIRYKNSSNLKYDASARTIHSNYNGWIQEIDNAIRVQLSLL